MNDEYILRDITPPILECDRLDPTDSCQTVLKGTYQGRKVYVVVVRQASTGEVGLEGRVGKGEAVIVVDRVLIDNKR